MIRNAGAVYLSDLTASIQTDPNLKALARPGSVVPVPVMVEVVSASGETLGYGPATGFEIVPRDGTKQYAATRSGVLVIRAVVKSLQARPDRPEGDGPQGESGPQCDPGPPAFDGTYPGARTEIRLPKEGPHPAKAD